MSTDYDVIVVGSGVAGLSVALGLAGARKVALITGSAVQSGSTKWAQGGLAAAIGVDDTATLHSVDTLTAGADFGDAEIIRVLTDAAPGALAELLRAGGRLDRGTDGRLSLTREGGHHRNRVVHAGGDASGAEVSRALSAAVAASDVDVLANCVVDDLLVVETATGPQVTGVVTRDGSGFRSELSARAVVLATGGVGGLFRRTTNPAEVRGAGLGLALRAGATLVDLEFVQFHPTALDVPTATGQVPLVTEALRGEGAILRDRAGRPIMAGQHPLADLAPRDIVARRVDEVITAGSPVFLDATAVDAAASRFPTVADACSRNGIDLATDPIPVVPTQHFLCGGIRTDSWGGTDVLGLYAIGEVAATGLHGANRLASNSLVEGMVFGRRAAARLVLDLPPMARGVARQLAGPAVDTASLPVIRELMSEHAGIRRTGAGLELAAKELDELVDRPSEGTTNVGDEWLAASAIVAAAGERTESRGCHWRSDHPAANEWWRRRVVVQLDPSGLPVASVTEPLGRTA